MARSENAVHLHADDYPTALALLAEVLGARRRDAVGLEAIGYEPSEYGVWVDWEALEHSWLSSTRLPPWLSHVA